MLRFFYGCRSSYIFNGLFWFICHWVKMPFCLSGSWGFGIGQASCRLEGIYWCLFGQDIALVSCRLSLWGLVALVLDLGWRSKFWKDFWRCRHDLRSYHLRGWLGCSFGLSRRPWAFCIYHERPNDSSLSRYRHRWSEDAPAPQVSKYWSLCYQTICTFYQTLRRNSWQARDLRSHWRFKEVIC